MGREASDVFFDLLCLLREQSGYKLADASIPDLAYDLRYPEAKLTRLIKEFALFTFDNGFFYSDRLIRDMEDWDAQKQFYKERAKKGGEAKAQKQAALKLLEAEQKQEKNVLTSAIKQINKQINKNDFVEEQAAPAIDGFRSLDSQRQRALADELYVAQVSQLGIPPERVPLWMDAFNRFLTFRGNTMKQEADYRVHFSRWLPKVPNYQSMDPAAYQPAGTATTNPNVNGLEMSETDKVLFEMLYPNEPK